MPTFFARHLLMWHADNPRPLPWDEGPRDPYHIWISEVIMQQTRIGQGASYYQKFILQFPTVTALADASLEDLMQVWEGLGYYSRVRNLHKAAKTIVEIHGGVFPETYAALLSLPGVGPYSAAAISSFAFNQRHPVIDGNVKRLLSRFEGVTESIDAPASLPILRQHAWKHIRDVDPATFNQAIMNYGAMMCRPKNPLCSTCELASKCYAYRNGLVEMLPVRNEKRLAGCGIFTSWFYTFRKRSCF